MNRMAAQVLVAFLLVGCGSSSEVGGGLDAATGSDAPTSADALADGTSTPPDASVVDAAPDADTSALVAARPYALQVPKSYDAKKATPLVILLHGYTASGATQEAYFKLGPTAEAHGFLYATPDGLKDKTGSRFWNANDACCNFDGNPVDDVAHVNAIIDDVQKKYTVDPKRVYLVGHSNGAFMAHRLACDSSARIAAIVALAGDVWADASKCKPTSPVAVLQIHGTLDAVIAYGGGANPSLAPYPSAPQSVSTWATKNGCASTAQNGAPVDFEPLLLGAETTVAEYKNCKPGGAAVLWSIQGGSHVPALQPTFGETVWTFLAAHPKP
jgi:polyhydroxybutyrate depolymerase